MKPADCACAYILLYIVQHSGAAIECFYCNSASNAACVDVNHYEPEVRARIVPIVDCEREIISPNVQSFFCRKIVQTNAIFVEESLRSACGILFKDRYGNNDIREQCDSKENVVSRVEKTGQVRVVFAREGPP
ncbi:hypothetical protein EVAR_10217_1 [Eumeta japonica]|uniref:Protein sleepless n=1 Tax=Eumeta variegata TaxID=151549 RepID=A0A4C1TEA8_EUMVA|nr:hypothetical protein EVAR_10217_1 [Eumeta japonica]